MFQTPSRFIRQAISGTGSVQQPTPSPVISCEPTDGISAKVLEALKSLQDQLTELKKKQNEEVPVTAVKSTRTPKELLSAVHSTVKHLSERIENPVRWNTSVSFTDSTNKVVTQEIINACINEKVSVAVVQKAVHKYFLTLRRRSKIIDKGTMDIVKRKQRTLQRKHNVRCMTFCLYYMFSCIISLRRNHTIA